MININWNEEGRLVRSTYCSNGRRARLVNRSDEEEYVTYGSVDTITEEIDTEHRRFYVLHIGDETATFNAADWELRIETFIRLW